jgi:hypothetical protein
MDVRYFNPKSASTFREPILASRSPLADISGIKIHAHVADFYENFIVYSNKLLSS